MADQPITRKALIDRLNEDLAREYQAIIAYVVYSQVLKGAAYMNIAILPAEAQALRELQAHHIPIEHLHALASLPQHPSHELRNARLARAGQPREPYRHAWLDVPDGVR